MFHTKKISRWGLCFMLIAVIALTLFGTLEQRNSSQAYAASNGVGQTPLLGWSSWSSLRGSITDAKIRAEADSMAKNLKSFGFTYINIDSGWTNSYDANGRPAPNLSKFPQGIAGIASYVHSKGLKLGIYMLP